MQYVECEHGTLEGAVCLAAADAERLLHDFRCAPLSAYIQADLINMRGNRYKFIAKEAENDAQSMLKIARGEA